jgi:hypothetical protein
VWTTDNSWYVGYWKSGEKDGLGNVKKPCGEILEGVWKNGKRIICSEDIPSKSCE